jgi:hypothetical protein
VKLGQTKDCITTLQGLFNKPLPFEVAEKICDVMLQLEEQHKKYSMLFDKLLMQYGKPIEGKQGQYSLPEESKDTYYAELEKLNETIIDTGEKKPMPKINEITPKELMYLREFFIFSESK